MIASISRVLGIVMIVSELAAPLVFLGLVASIFTEREWLAERAAPVVIAVFSGSAGPRIVAAALAATDPALQGQARADAMTKFLFFPGWSASRYLRQRN